jgi:hypothetical protein
MARRCGQLGIKSRNPRVPVIYGDDLPTVNVKQATSSSFSYLQPSLPVDPNPSSSLFIQPLQKHTIVGHITAHYIGNTDVLTR